MMPGPGSGTNDVSIVWVLILARLRPQELPTHRMSPSLSVPMRRGPWFHGTGALKSGALKYS